MKRLVLMLGVLLLAIQAVAQEACVLAEQAAVAQTATVCADQQVGQACYGSGQVRAFFYEGLASAFAAPADRVLIRNAQAFASYRTDDNNSLLRLLAQAYALESGQLVPLAWVLVQEAALIDQSPQLQTPELTVTPARGVNLRTGGGDNFRVLAPIAQGTVVRGTGRLADGAWVRVQLPDGRNGWVASSTLSGRTDVLPVAAANDTDVPRLFTAFTDVFLNTGGDSPCQGASPSGALLQTPDNATVDLRVNGVDLRVSGALFLESLLVNPEMTQLRVSLLRGKASVRTPQGSVDLAPAAYTSVNVDMRQPDARTPLDKPTAPLSYLYQRLYMLPTPLLLKGFFVAVDLAQFVQPRPREDVSPLAGMLVSEPCRLTTGEGGANLRAGAGREYPIMGVLGFRESARVTGRAIGTDGSNWWQIAPYVWVSGMTTVTGGDCVSVPLVPVPALR